MTQKNIVKGIISGSQMSIFEVHEESGIAVPNIRRILGQGEKDGTFKREARGIYSLKNKNGITALISMENALEEIKNITQTFDMVFLDIPYKTKAILGGNRGVKYTLISPEEFRAFMIDLKKNIHEDTAIYYMYSKAPCGLRDMERYNSILGELGFYKIAEGGWQKTYKDGSPVAFCGKVSEREGLALYNLSGKEYGDIEMDFISKRPPGKNEKDLKMLSKIVEQVTKIGSWVFDPFAGSGVCAEACLSQDRNSHSIEMSEERINEEIIPRLFSYSS